jgi:signal transduction histidine kinase
MDQTTDWTGRASRTVPAHSDERGGRSAPTRLESLSPAVVHDIKNLLQVIRGAAELLRRKGITGGEGEIRAILDATARADDLVRGVLDLERTQAPPMARVDLVEVVRRYVPMLRRSAPPDIKIVYEAVCEPVQLDLDVAGIEQMLLNLVANACDAIEEKGGGGMVRIEVGAVREGSAPWAWLRVVDDGAGMDALQLDGYGRQHYSTKPRGRGFGLGTSAVRTVVDHHGGRLDIRSAPGAGTAVTVFFPIRSSP